MMRQVWSVDFPLPAQSVLAVLTWISTMLWAEVRPRVARPKRPTRRAACFIFQGETNVN